MEHLLRLIFQTSKMKNCLRRPRIDQWRQTNWEIWFFFVIAQSNVNHKHVPFNQFPFSLSTGSAKSMTWSKHLLGLNKPLHLDKTFSKFFCGNKKVVHLFFHYSVDCPKSTDSKPFLLPLNGDHSVVLIRPECHLEALY